MRYRVFNDVPTHWELCAVEDVCEINPSQIGPDYPYSVIEYIDISSVSPRRLESVQVLPLKAAPSRAKRIVQEGDTIISTVRPNRRSFLYIKGAKPNTVVSTGFAVIRPREIDSRYAHYVLTSDPFIEHLTANATGSAYPAVSPEIIAKTLIPLPPKDEQKRIGEILGALDDKIELNHRMNRTLEAIARAIFKSWFVDFEPFLDGEFVDSDLGPIPKGWEVRLFSDCVEILSGGTPKTSVLEYWGRDIPWVSAKDASASRNIYIVKTEKSITKAGVENSVTQILPRNTTIITARGTVGKIVLTSKPMAMNQSCYAIRGKEEFGPFFIHFSLRQLVDQLKQKVHGTVFDTITRSTFSTLKVLVPPKETRTKYETVVEAIMGQILVNTSECCYLARIRNDLLPKLLSGKTWAGGR